MEAAPTTDVFIARQPICDAKLDTVAYELLFRSSSDNNANVRDGDSATSEVLLNAFTVIGLDELVGDHKAFINITRGFIVEKDRVNLPKDRVVLELLENVESDPVSISAVRDLVKEGYTIAMDDFEFQDELVPLVRLAEIVKIDVLALTKEQLINHVEKLKPLGVRLLAEKVESMEDFEYFKSLGFEFFQGFFLSRPKVFSNPSLDSNSIATLKLLSELHNPDAEVDDLERIIAADVSLSYKLLRYINSAFFQSVQKIESLRKAIMTLGINQLRAWATLVALSTSSSSLDSLMNTIMVRARLCELIAKAQGKKRTDQYFTAGLFSGLDAMMNTDLNSILEKLHLSDELVNAIVHQEGELGTVLKAAIAYEEAEWEVFEFLDLGVETNTLVSAYGEALEWADETLSEL